MQYWDDIDALRRTRNQALGFAACVVAATSIAYLSTTEKDGPARPELYATSEMIIQEHNGKRIKMMRDVEVSRRNHETQTIQPVVPIPTDENAVASVENEHTEDKAAARKPMRVQIERGDTLVTALKKSGIGVRESMVLANSIKKHYDLRKISIGQEILVHLSDPSPDPDAFRITEVIIRTAPGRQVVAWRNADGGFDAVLETVPMESEPVFASGVIKGSLFETAAAQQVPPEVMNIFIEAYSYDTDFQRELQEGDSFEVLYQTYRYEDGTPADKYAVSYAALKLRGSNRRFFHYEKANGEADFYDPNGVSIRKSLLKTPVNGARLSSGYGMRHHPILGYSRMHHGTDFAAPVGTPIYAAGDGVVEYAGWKGGYGKYVRIRHGSKYKTAYAHCSRIARGIRPGQRVKQKQIIGYVGSTGRSTGPHLHFEIHEHGQHVNPMAVKLPAGDTLKGKELARFKEKVSTLETQLAGLQQETQLAQKD